MKAKQWILRIFFYVLSLLILALGITLNTKAKLGVSPLVSVAYSTSEVFHLNFANATLGLYCIYVVIELIVRGKNRRYYDLLQIPLSIIFTRFMSIFGGIAIDPDTLSQKLFWLMIAVVLTGIGAAMSVNMRIVPNPGDGIVSALADCFGKEMGLMKNIVDFTSVCITFLIGLLSGHFMVGIGVGTVVAVLGVGRVVAAFNYFLKKPMAKWTGLSQAV